MCNELPTESVFEVFPMNPVAITRIPGLRTVQAFRDYIDRLGIDLQIGDSIRCRAHITPRETTEVE